LELSLLSGGTFQTRRRWPTHPRRSCLPTPEITQVDGLGRSTLKQIRFGWQEAQSDSPGGHAHILQMKKKANGREFTRLGVKNAYVVKAGEFFHEYS